MGDSSPRTVLTIADSPGAGLTLIFLWRFALMWGYFLFFEWLWQGQTPGKRVLGIRVIRRNGTSLSFVQSALRNLVRFVDLMPGFYGVGFLAAEPRWPCCHVSLMACRSGSVRRDFARRRGRGA